MRVGVLVATRLPRPLRNGDFSVTKLEGRDKTALVVIDVQNDVVANAHRRDEVIANINTLVDRARAADAPVIWVQHADDQLVEGTNGWAYVPELSRSEGEPLIHKQSTWSEGCDDRNLRRLVRRRTRS